MITLTNETQLALSVGNSRKSTSWGGVKMSVAELYSRLETPTRGTETLLEYLALPRSRQDDLKDVGGFVGGRLKGPRRLAANVLDRCIVTLDLDTIPPYGADSVIDKAASMGFGYCVYSTRKHRQEAPRLRILFPLNRSVTPDEYDAISRRLAANIGIQMADPTTFEPHRPMFWPSCCSDSEYIFRYADKPLLDADLILGLYADWHNWAERPQVPGSSSTYQKLAVKQGNPREKQGMVGTFCRVYNVLSAMEKYLPGIYEQTDTDPNRYTYLEGSTTGGAIIYDDGDFLYSHHATDPCCDKLVNAFDLVRLHKFGDKDLNAEPGVPVNRLPSFNAMCELAVADPAVISLVTRERREAAVRDFEGVEGETPTEDAENGEEWTQKLQRNPKNGLIKPTIENVMIILENDPLLRGKFALNKFAGRGEVLDRLPWLEDKARRMWSDTDSNGVYWYMEKVYDVNGRGAIDAALDLHSAKYAFNEVQDFLNGLEWDGQFRLDRLFIDYLGAEDTEYNRAVCRKAFVAAVARAMEPGCKFDNMLILCGPQGIGKSTILDRMSKGWFNDSIRTFEGKEASELLQGVWIVEIAELDAFRRTDVARIKQFLSLRADRYRAAYAKNAKEFPRCCVFFGTSNQTDFLQDTTGNRRFWPVDVGIVPHEKNVFDDLTPEVVDQVWAEAKMRWMLGEPLYLTDETAKAAQEVQEAHRDASSQEGLIAEFVSRPVPADWEKWTMEQRRGFWNGGTLDNVALVERRKITAIEVWCELFNRAQADIKRTDSREINAILSNIPGWKRQDKTFRCGPYGVQRGYSKTD